MEPSNEEMEEFARKVYGVYDRIYLLKTCIERNVETVGEFESVCRELACPEYIHDAATIRALAAWNNLWHDFEIPDPE